MRVLVTGSAGHLGEALVRTLTAAGHAVVALDRLASPFTTAVGSITDAALVRRCLDGVDAVLHCATLHKPHVATHSAQAFIDTNITGTLTLLEGARAAGVGAFIFTSTTSAFGDALRPAAGSPAVWVNEALAPVPRNIYGVSKCAAEDLCALFHRNHRLACLVLRTSRFFPEADDDADARREYDDTNLKLSEYLYRRVDLEDVVSAHLRAIERAPTIGFGRYIISATTPFTAADVDLLGRDPAAALRRRVPEYAELYGARGWRLPPRIDRVYDNARARRELGWAPRHDFRRALARLAAGEPLASPLALAVGSKGYHAEDFAAGPYPVDGG